MARITSHHDLHERYPSLRIVSAIFSVLGVLSLVAGGLLLAYSAYHFLAGATTQFPSDPNSFLARPAIVPPLPIGLGGVLSLMWSLGLLATGLQFLAMGVLFRLAINVEENTRVTAQCLEQLRLRIEPRDENVGPLFRS